MTALEMKQEFLARYDAATSLAAPGWEDSEISSFLNIAQLRIVNELYAVKNYNPISNLIKTASAVPVLQGTIANAYALDLATLTPNYLYYLRSRTKLTRTSPGIDPADWVPNDKLTNQEDSSLFHITAFNKPWFKYPKCYTEVDGVVGSLIILTDYYTTSVIEAEITWVDKPVTINITTNTSTDLDLVLHPTIIEYAVEEALKSIKIAKTSNQ